MGFKIQFDETSLNEAARGYREKADRLRREADRQDKKAAHLEEMVRRAAEGHVITSTVGR